MGTKILLAGAETRQMLDFLKECNARFILISFFYVRHKWGKNLDELKEYLTNFEFVLLDSGAFTLFSKPLTYDTIERYAYDYAEFILDFKKYITAAVELDLYEKEEVGQKSHRLREDILDKTGVDILPVYHGDFIPINQQSFSDWQAFCKKYRYVGVASKMVEAGPSKIAGLVTEAAKHGTMVHGFGITKQDFIKTARFYTCDSSAWTNGQRFGSHYVFEHNKLRIYSNLYKEPARRKNMSKWKRAGLPLDGLEKDQTDTFTRLNCWEWARFQNWVANQCNRDYWQEIELNPERIGKKFDVKCRGVSMKKRQTWTEFFDSIEDGVPYRVIFKTEKRNWVSTWETVDENTKRETRVSRKALQPDKEDTQDTHLVWREPPVGQEIDKHEWEYNHCFKTRMLNDEYIIHKERQEQFLGEVSDEVSEDFQEEDTIEISDGTQEDFNDASMDLMVVDHEEKLAMTDIATNQVLKCADCYLAGRCKYYNEVAYCAYVISANIQSPKDLADNLSKLLEVQFDRVFKGALIEKLDGGVLDKTMSDEIMKTFKMAREFRDIFSERNEVVIKASGKQGTGIIAQMFGGGKKDD